MRIESNKYLTGHELVVDWKRVDRVTICHFSEHESSTPIESFYIESSLPKSLI